LAKQSSEGLLSQPQIDQHVADTNRLKKTPKLPRKQQDMKELKQEATLGV